MNSCEAGGSLQGHISLHHQKFDSRTSSPAKHRKTRYYRIMECPVCKQAMKKVRWDISHNPNENDKEYDRTVYQCLTDDIWVTTEIPKADSSQQHS
jgi:hypothetical protein